MRDPVNIILCLAVSMFVIGGVAFALGLDAGINIAGASGMVVALAFLVSIVERIRGRRFDG